VYSSKSSQNVCAPCPLHQLAPPSPGEAVSGNAVSAKRAESPATPASGIAVAASMLASVLPFVKLGPPQDANAMAQADATTAPADAIP
jgi:hypothetical protein